MPYVHVGKAFYLEAILPAYFFLLYLTLVSPVEKTSTRIRSLFVLGINFLQYFVRSMVPTPRFLPLNGDTEPICYGGEIHIPG